MAKPDYDTTLARIAGNVAGHLACSQEWRRNDYRADASQYKTIAFQSVRIARSIVAEIKRTEGDQESHDQS
jgi:hypothetical protein